MWPRCVLGLDDRVIVLIEAGVQHVSFLRKPHRSLQPPTISVCVRERERVTKCPPYLVTESCHGTRFAFDGSRELEEGDGVDLWQRRVGLEDSRDKAHDQRMR